VRGWLLTVARNLITDRYRAKSARPVEVPESPTTPPVQEDHAQQVVGAMIEARPIASSRPKGSRMASPAR
jgi:RNA polymerase sigma-70 factor (ECF subfamily)